MFPADSLGRGKPNFHHLRPAASDEIPLTRFFRLRHDDGAQLSRDRKLARQLLIRHGLWPTILARCAKTPVAAPTAKGAAQCLPPSSATQRCPAAPASDQATVRRAATTASRLPITT